MRHRDYLYHFETKQFTVRAYVQDEAVAPDFDCPEDNEAIANGDVQWFCVTVEVLKNGKVIGSDHLGGCAYRDPLEFFDGHRDHDPMNRNCSIMRKARGHNVVICHYFPSMVHQAIADARNTLA